MALSTISGYSVCSQGAASQVREKGSTTMDEKQHIPRMIERIYALEQKLAKVEQQLAAFTQTEIQGSAPPPSAGPLSAMFSAPPALPGVPPPATEQTEPTVERSAAPKANLESLIAGRWLNRIGLLLILIATAFGLKYAFDNAWIGPTGRVALGIISGVGLLISSQWLRGRGYGYFSEGITALGGGVLYLSLYAGWDFYKLFSSGLAFAAMIAVTATILGIAERLNSERAALLAMIGGFLTPVLVSTGQNAETVLFGYILILDGSLLWLARKHNWRTLEPVAWFFSVVYFWGWYGRFYNVSEPLLLTGLFASGFFAVFLALPAVRARAHGSIREEQVVLVLFNAGNYLLVLHRMLWPDHRWALTGAMVALALLHLLLNTAIPRADKESNVVRTLFAGLALTFVSLAIPIRLDGIWITMAWSIEGAVLIWNGFRVRWWFLRTVGFVLFTGVVLRLSLFMPAADVFLLNQRFATFVVAIASFGVAVYLWSRERSLVSKVEGELFEALAIAANVLSLWALSLEVRQYFSAFEARFVRQLALSLLWTLCALGLLVGGVRRRAAGLRWQGLALFGLVVAKVFLYDLSILTGGYRIVSSIVLGGVLLGVSFLYQRHISTGGSLT